MDLSLTSPVQGIAVLSVAQMVVMGPDDYRIRGSIVQVPYHITTRPLFLNETHFYFYIQGSRLVFQVFPFYFPCYIKVGDDCRLRPVLPAVGEVVPYFWGIIEVQAIGSFFLLFLSFAPYARPNAQLSFPLLCA